MSRFSRHLIPLMRLQLTVEHRDYVGSILREAAAGDGWWFTMVHHHPKFVEDGNENVLKSPSSFGSMQVNNVSVTKGGAVPPNMLEPRQDRMQFQLSAQSRQFHEPLCAAGA